MKDRLRQFDLNLLLAFRTLMEERSVSKTAERLFVSQPAISKSLKRLRELCGDELFTRSSQGLIPTPVAQRYYPVVVTALTNLEHTLFDSGFDPSTIEDQVNIAILESSTSWCIPHLVSRFQTLAPGLTLITSDIELDSLDKLTNGKLDFAIYPEQAFGPGYDLTPLSIFQPVVWLSLRHPLSQKPELLKSDVESHPLIMLDTPDMQKRRFMQPKAFLERVGLNCSPALKTSTLHAALELLYSTDAMMIAPTTLKHSVYVSDFFQFKSIIGHSSFDQYSVQLMLIQHHRTSGSAMHAWVKQQLIEIIGDQATLPRREAAQ